MSAERSPLTQIGQNLLDSLAPKRKERRVMAEQAKNTLDLAWDKLGKEGPVTEEQVLDVLRAELGVLKTSSAPIPRSIFPREGLLREAQDFHTSQGLVCAMMIMSAKADEWRRIVHVQNVTGGINSETSIEAQRRADACVEAYNLLTSMHKQLMHF